MVKTNKQKTINIRIDSKLKRQSEKTLKKMGLNISSAVRMFLAQVVKEGGIPFKIKN